MNGISLRQTPHQLAVNCNITTLPRREDILGKLSAAIRNMEQEVGIADIISVLTGLIDWVRATDLEKAKEITRLADAYIKDKL